MIDAQPCIALVCVAKKIPVGIDCRIRMQMTKGKLEFHPDLDLALKMKHGHVTKFDLVASGFATNGFGDRQAYAGDFTLRAAAAAAGIYGNNAVEALYPILATDSDGNKPDGDTSSYTLTFPAGGQYAVYNEFETKGGQSILYHTSLTVGGATAACVM